MMKTARGTTLIEIAIASAVLAVMMAFIMLVLFNAGSEGENTAAASNMANRGQEALTRLRSEILYSRFTLMNEAGAQATVASGGLFDDNCTIRYQLPISPVGGQARYGSTYQESGQPVVVDPGGYYELTFVADTIFRETSGPVPATTPRVPAGIEEVGSIDDLNGDGDLRDTFVRGRLVKRIYDHLTPPLPLGTPKVVENFDNYVTLRVRPDNPALLNGDMKSDAAAVVHPLFQILNSLDGSVANTNISTAARKVRVILWHTTPDSRGRRFLEFRNQDDIRLENPQ